VKKSPIAKSTGTCAQCGSQLSTTDGTETLCVNCLLRAALNEDDLDFADAPRPFDQYELIIGDDGTPIELGRGAMGVTYKAFDTNLRCEVALKVIHPRYLADESSRARFLSEARAAAQLRHRNVASVFHLGSERGEYFYAMELVEGETIEERVHRKGPIDCASALDIALQITRALVATGSRQFVHRDVKPSNIMLCTEADGAIVAKLIDFGLVRPVSARAAAESRGYGFVGTPDFASPEQFAGKATDTRSDIYSLGVTLWFMLAGKLPFTGTREQIRQQQLNRLLPLDQLKGVRRGVVDLIKRMLDADPAKRPQSPAALQEQLNKCISAIDVAKGKQRRRLAYTWLAAAVVIIGALGASYILQNKLIPSKASEIVPEKSIAVLPFENLSEEKGNAFFADGLQDEILTDLSRIADLKVIGRASVMHYKTGTARNLRQIGQQLGVAHVVEGSIQRSGNRVRVNAQLVDARTEQRVWGRTYDRDLTDVFVIESDIATAIAGQLQARLSQREKDAIEQPPTSDLTAFDLYARGDNILTAVDFSSNAKADLLRAADLMNQAVARDPTFLQAYCLLAWVHDYFYFLGFDRTPARLALAEGAIEAAFRLRPDAGEAHLARAWNLYLGYLDYGGALVELEFARESLPNSPRILRLMGYIQRRQGRWEESARSLERALELDPRNTFMLQEIAWQYLLLRRYDDVKSLLARVLAIEPDRVDTKVMFASIDFHWKADTRPFHQMIDSIRAGNPSAIPTIARAWLICSLAERDAAAANDALMASGENTPLNNEAVHFNRPFVEGLIARMMNENGKARSAFTVARAEQEKIIRAEPNFGPPMCVLGLIDAGLGRKEEALREARRAVELLPVEKDAINGPLMIEYSAMIAAWVGDKDLACEQLGIAIHSPSGLNYGQLKLLPFWDPLRGDPRFEKLVEEAKQPIALK